MLGNLPAKERFSCFAFGDIVTSHRQTSFTSSACRSCLVPATSPRRMPFLDRIYQSAKSMAVISAPLPAPSRASLFVTRTNLKLLSWRRTGSCCTLLWLLMRQIDRKDVLSIKSTFLTNYENSRWWLPVKRDGLEGGRDWRHPLHQGEVRRQDPGQSPSGVG